MKASKRVPFKHSRVLAFINKTGASDVMLPDTTPDEMAALMGILYFPGVYPDDPVFAKYKFTEDELFLVHRSSALQTLFYAYMSYVLKLTVTVLTPSKRCSDRLLESVNLFINAAAQG